MRYCFDIDGTIAELRQKGETYVDVKPKEGAVEFQVQHHARPTVDPEGFIRLDHEHKPD